MAFLDGGDIVAIYYLAFYIFGGIEWHLEGQPGWIFGAILSPFVFPAYAAVVAVLGRSKRVERRLERERKRKVQRGQENAGILLTWIRRIHWRIQTVLTGEDPRSSLEPDYDTSFMEDERRP